MLSVTNLSWVNNLPVFRMNAPVVIKDFQTRRQGLSDSSSETFRLVVRTFRLFIRDFQTRCQGLSDSSSVTFRLVRDFQTRCQGLSDSSSVTFRLVRDFQTRCQGLSDSSGTFRLVVRDFQTRCQGLSDSLSGTFTLMTTGAFSQNIGEFCQTSSGTKHAHCTHHDSVHRAICLASWPWNVSGYHVIVFYLLCPIVSRSQTLAQRATTHEERVWWHLIDSSGFIKK